MGNEAALKRDYRMPFEYFEDEEWRTLRRTQPGMEDPERYFQAHLRKPPGQPEKWLLNVKNQKLFERNGWFKPPYFHGDLLEDQYDEHDAFVLCPGPSLGEYDLSVFKDKLTIAVNSAGFKLKTMFWAAFESNYLTEVLINQNIPPDRVWIMTARVAVRWRDMYKKTDRCRRVYVPRFEERRNMPNRSPAVGAMGAITSAWWMGAKRIFVVGQDLSRPGKQPYIAGVPRGQTGSTHPFDDQIRAMKQFTLPDVQIFNASPHSKKVLPFEPIDREAVEEIAAASPAVVYPKHENQA